jgi:hypothetical protein
MSMAEAFAAGVRASNPEMGSREGVLVREREVVAGVVQKWEAPTDSRRVCVAFNNISNSSCWAVVGMLHWRREMGRAGRCLVGGVIPMWDMQKVQGMFVLLWFLSGLLGIWDGGWIRFLQFGDDGRTVLLRIGIDGGILHLWIGVALLGIGAIWVIEYVGGWRFVEKLWRDVLVEPWDKFDRVLICSWSWHPGQTLLWWSGGIRSGSVAWTIAGSA